MLKALIESEILRIRTNQENYGREKIKVSNKLILKKWFLDYATFNEIISPFPGVKLKKLESMTSKIA